MTPFFRRLGHFFGRRRFEADFKDELRIHEEMAAADLEHGGADNTEARFAARRRLGNTAHLAESARAVWSPPALADLLQDLRYALRGLRRRPGYAAAAIVTLVLGIGATTALFSVLDAVLLTPLPYPQSDRLVQVWEHNIPRNQPTNLVSPANFLGWRDRARSFSGLAAWTWANIELGGDAPEQISGRAVSTNLFPLLRVEPMLGRLFGPEDTLPGARQAILLSHALWTRRFGGDPAVVGKPVQLRQGTALIIGVMPRNFRRLSDEEYWEPWPMTSELRPPRGRYALVLGRLKDGVSVAAAGQEMKTIAGALTQDNPKFNAGWTINVVSLQAQVTGAARPVLLLLAGAIAAVLLIACANVANLKLGQVLARRTELAVRAALGASRGRILRQMVVEGLVLALVGGVLGTLAAAASIRALIHARVTQIPRLAEVGIDLRVLAFALIVTALAGVTFGLAPVVALKEKSLRQPLSRRGGEGNEAPRARRLRGALVSFQVALCLMLLTGAGLTIRSLDKLLDVDPGFDPAGLLTAELSLPQDGYAEPERRIAFYEALAQRVSELRGVTDVGLVNFLPMRGITPATSVHVVGQPEPPAGQTPVSEVNTGDGRYFSAMKTALVQGRAFTDADRAGAPNVVMINQAFARNILGGVPPIGQRIRIDMGQPDSVVEIIGVVANIRREALDVEPRPSVYYPFLQNPSGYMTLVIRTTGDAAALAGPVRAQVAAMDRSLPVLSTVTMTARLAETMEGRRYPMLLLSGLATLALVLAAVGLYGVLAYIVGQRSREIGLRRALGATPGAIARLVATEGVRFVGGGLVIGLVASLATARFLGKLLYGLSPNDPLTFAAVAAVLVGVAALATWLPARRAMRVDPAVTLREDG